MNVLQITTQERIKHIPLGRGTAFSASLFILRQGHQIAPHVSSTPAMVLILEGKVAFMLKEAVSVLGTGDVVAFGANEIHALQALEDTRFLLIK